MVQAVHRLYAATGVSVNGRKRRKLPPLLRLALLFLVVLPLQLFLSGDELIALDLEYGVPLGRTLIHLRRTVLLFLGVSLVGAMLLMVAALLHLLPSGLYTTGAILVTIVSCLVTLGANALDSRVTAKRQRAILEELKQAKR